MKSLYIICAKCGCSECFFINNEYTPEEIEDCGCGISIVCDDCGTMTSAEEWNEQEMSSPSEEELEKERYRRC